MAVAQRVLNLGPLADLRSDRALVRSAQSGRKEAASALIERYYPKVRTFVSYLTGGNGKVDDLTQEVFTRALAALGRFNGDYRFGPWIYRIAKNLCIDEARRSNFRPEPADPADLPLLEAMPSDSDHVWESISSQLSSSIVRRALERLNSRQRAALVLKEIEGLSYAEIAQVIGTGVRGVEATLRRARSNFRLAVGTVEESDIQHSSCTRILRSIADDPKKAKQFRPHLRGCQRCRSKASSIASADKLLGLLPPIAFGTPTWKSDLIAKLAGRPAPRRGLLQAFRGHPSIGLASPVAQIAQYAASLAVAASVSVASVTGVVRVGLVAGAPEAVIDESASPTGRMEGSHHGAAKIFQPQGILVDQKSNEASLATRIDAALDDLGVGLRVAELAGPALELVGLSTKAVGELPATEAPQSKPGSPQPSSGAVLPAPVVLPRRRPHQL